MSQITKVRKAEEPGCQWVACDLMPVLQRCVLGICGWRGTALDLQAGYQRTDLLCVDRDVQFHHTCLITIGHLSNSSKDKILQGFVQCLLSSFLYSLFTACLSNSHQRTKERFVKNLQLYQAALLFQIHLSLGSLWSSETIIPLLSFFFFGTGDRQTKAVYQQTLFGILGWLCWTEVLWSNSVKVHALWDQLLSWARCSIVDNYKKSHLMLAALLKKNDLYQSHHAFALQLMKIYIHEATVLF